jgi:hypothetical protein
MAGVILEVPSKNWECPSCGFQTVTRDPRPHMPTHPCPKYNGFSVPLVEVFGDALKKHSVRHVVKERDDYVGKEIVQLGPDGKPIMALITERADGSNDTRIYAPTAQPDR